MPLLVDEPVGGAVSMLDVVLRAIEVERVPELAEREQISLELAYDGDVVIVKLCAVEQVPESLILEGHLGLKGVSSL